MRAIEVGNPFQIKAAREFNLRTTDTLRRLDLAVETERRNAEEQVPQKQVEAVSLYVAEWLRIAFAQFLSSESRSLMGSGIWANSNSTQPIVSAGSCMLQSKPVGKPIPRFQPGRKQR
jgi:hypothetical protein